MYNVHNINNEMGPQTPTAVSIDKPASVHYSAHPNLPYLYDCGAHIHVWAYTLASVKLHDGSSTDYIIETAAEIIAACHSAVARGICR